MPERIEPLEQGRLDECAHLLVSAFNVEPWNDNWTLATAKEGLTWTLKVPGYAALVSIGSGVVAFAAGYREPDDVREVFWLRTFCVKPDAQGRGVGSRLLACLKKTLGERGVNTIYLITHRGTPAEAVYRKNGYRVATETS